MEFLSERNDKLLKELKVQDFFAAYEKESLEVRAYV